MAKIQDVEEAFEDNDTPEVKLGEENKQDTPGFFEVSQVSQTRAEIRIQNNISDIKEACGELQDQEVTLQCFDAVQNFDNQMSEIIRQQAQRR